MIETKEQILKSKGSCLFYVDKTNSVRVGVVINRDIQDSWYINDKLQEIIKIQCNKKFKKWII